MKMNRKLIKKQQVVAYVQISKQIAIHWCPTWFSSNQLSEMKWYVSLFTLTNFIVEI